MNRAENIPHTDSYGEEDPNLNLPVPRETEEEKKALEELPVKETKE